MRNILSLMVHSVVARFFQLGLFILLHNQCNSIYWSLVMVAQPRNTCFSVILKLSLFLLTLSCLVSYLNLSGRRPLSFSEPELLLFHKLSLTSFPFVVVLICYFFRPIKHSNLWCQICLFFVRLELDVSLYCYNIFQFSILPRKKMLLYLIEAQYIFRVISACIIHELSLSSHFHYETQSDRHESFPSEPELVASYTN